MHDALAARDETHQEGTRMATQAIFALAGHELTVSGKLDADGEQAFDRALRELVATDAEELYVDFQTVTYMSSTYVGLLVAALGAAVAAGRRLTISASSRTYRLLRMAGVEHLGEIRVQDD